MKIFEKLSKIMAEVGPIAKDGFNSHSNYKYTSIEAMYNSLSPLLSRHGVIVTCEIISWNVSEYASPSQSNPHRLSYYAQGHFRYWFSCGENDKVSTDVIAGASDTGDKSMMQAMSQAQKYAYKQVFNIHTDDVDPDSKTPEPVKAIQKPQPTKEPAIGSIPDEKFSHDMLKKANWNGRYYGGGDEIKLIGKSGKPKNYKLTDKQKQSADQYLNKLAMEIQSPLKN